MGEEVAMKQIAEVLSVDVKDIGRGQYRIDAVGRVSTGGYRRPALISSGIISGGVLEYTFEAEGPSPGTIVTQAFEKLKASATIGGPGTRLDGLNEIRVSGTRSSAVAAFPPD
jgi:hypothetical protein